jgi:hypothetical protein
VLAIRRPTPTSFCDSLPMLLELPALALPALPALPALWPALVERRALPDDAVPPLWEVAVEGLEEKSLLDWVMFAVPAICR